MDTAIDDAAVWTQLRELTVAIAHEPRRAKRREVMVQRRKSPAPAVWDEQPAACQGAGVDVAVRLRRHRSP